MIFITEINKHHRVIIIIISPKMFSINPSRPSMHRTVTNRHWPTSKPRNRRRNGVIGTASAACFNFSGSRRARIPDNGVCLTSDSGTLKLNLLGDPVGSGCRTSAKRKRGEHRSSLSVLLRVLRSANMSRYNIQEFDVETGKQVQLTGYSNAAFEGPLRSDNNNPEPASSLDNKLSSIHVCSKEDKMVNNDGELCIRIYHAL